MKKPPEDGEEEPREECGGALGKTPTGLRRSGRFEGRECERRRSVVVQRQTPSPVSLTPRIHNLECVGRANID